MTIGLNRWSLKAGLLGAALACLPFHALADVSETFHERSVVVAADARCRLFAPAVSAALAAAQAQARGAALRAGASDVAVAQTEARARARAAAVSCRDPSLKTVQARVQSAFAGWIRMARMSFPGTRGAWTAERTLFKSGGWRLAQDAAINQAHVRFGATGGLYAPEQVAAVVSFPGRSRPYAARLVMRDAARAPRAWLGRDSSLPPAAMRRAVWSSGYSKAEPALLPAKTLGGETWAFPAEALKALEALDPRESFAVEFVFHDDSVATAVFEAGDLSAARAFLAMGSL